jgi:thioredoxin-like negative regulator of GroEL
MIEVLLQAERALSLGSLDRAEILYRQVAGADPRNSIAVMGLARVALERGDESGALALARRALAMDAESPAAQRMVRRLEGVLTSRGLDGSATTCAAPAGSAAPVEAATVPPDPARSPAALAPEPPSMPVPGSGTSVVADPHRRSLLDRLLRRR